MKPEVKRPTDPHGIGGLVRAARKALEDAGQQIESREMARRCFNAKKRDEVIKIVEEYVTLV
ncbi:MAG: hypothetical protein PHI12_07835 [Dehalococcoidales bacterium]|jgi:hypothetical protein|nr:hypothetical protein [Dehalococcoidales bacterium]